MSKSSAKLLILLLVSLMIIGIATGIISDSQRRRRDAENLLVTARPFVVGTTTLATAQKELKAYQSYGNKKMVCNATDCTLSYEITNRWLHVLRLAPGTGFGIVLWFRNGILQRKDMYLGHDLCCVIFVREYNSESVTSERSKYKEPTVKLSQDGTGLVVKARIAITPESTNRERAIADGFNFLCLTKFGGCPSAEDLLPGISQIASSLNSSAD